MRTTILFTFFASLAAVATAADDAAPTRRAYARILATLVEPTEELADSGAGVLLELGSEPLTSDRDDPMDAFDGVFTCGWIGWSQSESFEGVNLDADADLFPLLIGLRYRIALGRAHLAIGPCAGATYSRIAARAEFEDLQIRASSSRWNFSWGGEAALVVPIAKRWHLSAGYKYISTDAGSVTYEGVEYSLGDVDTHVYYAGFGWAW